MCYDRVPDTGSTRYTSQRGLCTRQFILSTSDRLWTEKHKSEYGYVAVFTSVLAWVTVEMLYQRQL